MSAGSSAMVKIAGEPQAGFFKMRARKRGPWCPVRVWLRDGERDEAGELMEDQKWCGEWNPDPHNPFAFYTFDVFERWEWLHPIDEEEFQWLLTLKTL